MTFGWDFEVNAWSRFWRWNLIKICVWTCDMTYTCTQVTLVSWTQPSGPLCLWQVFQPKPFMKRYQLVYKEVTNWAVPFHSVLKNIFIFNKKAFGFSVQFQLYKYNVRCPGVPRWCFCVKTLIYCRIFLNIPKDKRKNGWHVVCKVLIRADMKVSQLR